MAYTQDDLERINRAIASDQLEVSYGDKRVKFRSTAELIQARDEIVKDLQASATPRSRVTRIRHGGKGL